MLSTSIRPWPWPVGLWEGHPETEGSVVPFPGKRLINSHALSTEHLPRAGTFMDDEMIVDT